MEKYDKMEDKLGFIYSKSSPLEYVANTFKLAPWSSTRWKTHSHESHNKDYEL